MFALKYKPFKAKGRKNVIPGIISKHKAWHRIKKKTSKKSQTNKQAKAIKVFQKVCEENHNNPQTAYMTIICSEEN